MSKLFSKIVAQFNRMGIKYNIIFVIAVIIVLIGITFVGGVYVFDYSPVRVNIRTEDLSGVLNSGQQINLDVDSWAQFNAPISFEWDDGGCGGTFCSSSNERNPSWYLINHTGSPIKCTLKVEASIYGWAPEVSEYQVTVLPTPAPSLTMNPTYVTLDGNDPSNQANFNVELNMPAEYLMVSSNQPRKQMMDPRDGIYKQSIQLNIPLCPNNSFDNKRQLSFIARATSGGGESSITVSAPDFPSATATINALPLPPVLRFRTIKPGCGAFTTIIPDVKVKGAISFRVVGPKDTYVTITRLSNKITFQGESSTSPIPQRGVVPSGPNGPPRIIFTLPTGPPTNCPAGIHYFEFGIKGETEGSYIIEASASGFATVQATGKVVQ